MLRYFLNLAIGMIRAVIRGASRFFKGMSGIFIVALLSLNLIMVAVPTVYNFLSGVVWSGVSVLSEGYATRNATNAKSKAELDADANQRRQLEVERDRLHAERVEVETRLRRTETELMEVRELEQKAVQDLLDARRQNSLNLERAQRAEIELSRATSETLQSRRTASEILTRMQQRALQMVSRNTVTVFTDALPLIGTVTVVGGIAWDIWDTCAQLDDLKEISTTLELASDMDREIEEKWCGLSKGDILASLFVAPPTDEFLCVQARLQTGSLDPLECKDFPISLSEFSDPLDHPEAPQWTLPSMNYD